MAKETKFDALYIPPQHQWEHSAAVSVVTNERVNSQLHYCAMSNILDIGISTC